ncbi:MAG: MBOAT family protein [Lachnospiraceae bacterium]|nr:MBOAT family protein [Lachnospiraceae bacterium]
MLLLILGYFKYYGFFLNGFRQLFALDSIALNIILPAGISFYTFTSISYLIDVYCGRYEPEKNILNFSLFISFFPKLMAGPIVRGSCFIPQVRNYEGIRLTNIETGVQIFVIGLFKKIVLADRLGVFVDDVFFSPSAYNTFTVILAVFSYTMQIYFDFSGYSDMAVGIAKIVGFDFPPNFNLPYIAQGISDFWSRWHISLSSWFRDYLYIPLGGNRNGIKRTCINLLIVMVLSGLWHGAAWTFILWGVAHGIVSCVSKYIETRSIGKSIIARSGRIPQIIFTLIIVSLLWVIFRADSISNAARIYKAIFVWQGGMMKPYTWSFFAMSVLLVSTVTAWIKSKKNVKCNNQLKIDGFYPIMKLDRVWTLSVFFIFAGLTVILAYFGNTAFIYGQF